MVASVQRAVPATIAPGSRLVMFDVDWETYSHFLQLLGEGSKVRLTYDRGTLEIRSPSLRHDDESRSFLHFIQILAEESGLPYRAGGSVTMRRKPKQSGLEADESVWLRNAPRMAGRRSLDLRRDPPPDLAVEIDLRRSRVDRMGVYARLGVPEIWRLGKKGLVFYRLEGRKYQTTSESVSFPGVSAAFVERFVKKARDAEDMNVVLREFRQAIRTRK